MISTRIQNLSSSPTLLLDGRVKQLQAQGLPIINLSLGEPDFDTPRHIQDAACEAMHNGFTHYTATAGIIELREAIVTKVKEDNHIEYHPNDVVVGVGSKQLLYNTFQVLCEPGDEVIIPTPTWSSYVEQVKIADAQPVLVPLSSPFKLKAADIEPFISQKTKIILLNSPSNPTGAMIDRLELEKIGELAVKHNLFIISDEIYEKILYQGEHISIASLSPEIKERTITINGFSKAYAMTGWRIGYAAGPEQVIKGMVKLQSQTTSNTTSFGQKAGVAALRGSQKPIEEMVAEFMKRQEYLLKELSSIPGLSCTLPEGAFYLFVSIKELLGEKYKTSEDWCNALLEQKYVGVVPGEAFFAPGYFRLSFAASMENLQEAVRRIGEFVKN